MKIFFFVLVLVSFSALAESDFAVEVYSTEEGADLSLLEDPRYQKKTLKPEAPLKSDLPPPKMRDRMLAAAGLDKEISSLDSMDRDILFRRAARFPPETLQKSYPQISKEKLVRLKEIIHEK